MSHLSFDAIDLFGGLFSFTERSPTLDGSIPLRAAQACVPLLEGNAWGLQLTLTSPLKCERRLGRLTASFGERHAEIVAWHTAAIHQLGAEGILEPKSPWWPILRRGVVSVSRSTVRIFSGLLVRPPKGYRLRVSATANRVPLGIHIEETVYPDRESYVPLFLNLDARSLATPAMVRGEVATIGMLPEHVAIRTPSRDDTVAIAEAHTRFYDAAYFATKRAGRTTKKYRREVPPPSLSNRTSPPTLEYASFGVDSLRPAAPSTIATSRGYEAATGEPDRLIFRNPVTLDVSFDGVHVDVIPDAKTMARYVDDVRTAWAPLFKRLGIGNDTGALLYLTKYVTPHPPGEPYFFVKPPSLLRTSPGISLLVEGVHAGSYDVLRGVVRTESFHAAPAVFHLRQPGRIRIPSGTPLATLLPIPHSTEPLRARVETRGIASRGGSRL